ncbi:MAG: phospholipase D-like domain-containing protein [Oscillospiraceae bacterium]|nr:phospholipase D-like domain-containing protein [Oscillospiraceae bacterium]
MAREKNGKKRLRRWVGICAGLLLCFFLYVLIGVLVPSLFQQDAGGAEATALSDSSGERVLCVDDNQEALLWRLRLIEAAQEEIILSTFDWRDDDSGQAIMAALLAAAERGVRVRVLVDGMNAFLHLRGNVHFQALAASPNVKIKLYSPVNLLKPWMLNYRLHDKYLIADQTAYLLGGRNTNDLFLGEATESSNIDREILVWQEAAEEDSSLAQLLDYFEQVWALDSNRLLTPDTTKKITRARQELLALAEQLEQTYPEACEDVDWRAATLETGGVTLLTNGYLPENKQPILWETLCQLMAQGSDILIQTPYIIANQTMYDDLAAVCAGADSVTMMLNAPENVANPFGCSDYLNEKESVLSCGLTVVEWMGGRSLHTKTVLIDDSLCVVGSMNFDMRSVYLDTELMLVIDCPELNRQLRAGFADMAEYSRTVSPDGSAVSGAQLTVSRLSAGKTALYQILRVVLRPFRYLL